MVSALNGPILEMHKKVIEVLDIFMTISRIVWALSADWPLIQFLNNSMHDSSMPHYLGIASLQPSLS